MKPNLFICILVRVDGINVEISMNPNDQCRMYKVKALPDRTALNTVLTTAQTTRVALVKASKNKANLATDEVHVENRNHGLAWGNNRTVAIQKLIPINHCSISSLY